MATMPRFGRPTIDRLVGGVLAAAVLASPAMAAWPDDRPIQILVGYQAGSGPDLMARRIAPVIAKHLGGKASFVIENRTGASNELALSALARAEPNGYTMGVLITPSFITVEFIRKLQYDPAAIMPLARVVDDPTLLVTSAKSPYKSLKDVIDRLKAAPESVSIGNNGVGTNGYLATLALEQSAGVTVNVIPFKGSSESRTALLGGHLDVAGQSVSEHALDKEALSLIRPLAQFGPERVKLLHEVPTAKEFGIAALISSERGLAVPRGTPAAIVERLQKAIAAAVEDQDFYLHSNRDELQVSYLPGSEWEKSMQERKVRYGEIMKKAPQRKP